MVLALKSVWAKPEAICRLLADRIQVASRLPTEPALRFARTANGGLDIGGYLFIWGFGDLFICKAVIVLLPLSMCSSATLEHSLFGIVIHL